MRKPKIMPEAIYECLMGFSGDHDGVPISVRQGARLKGDTVAVRKWPQYFIPDGTDDGTKAQRWQELVGPPIVPQDDSGVTVLEPMSGPDVVESTEDWQFGFELVSKGTRLRESHRLARVFPQGVVTSVRGAAHRRASAARSHTSGCFAAPPPSGRGR